MDAHTLVISLFAAPIVSLSGALLRLHSCGSRLAHDWYCCQHLHVQLVNMRMSAAVCKPGFAFASYASQHAANQTTVLVSNDMLSELLP